MANSTRERPGAVGEKHYLPAWGEKQRSAGGSTNINVRATPGGEIGAHKTAAVLDHPDGSVVDAKLADDVKVGSLAALLTSVQSSVVGAINEIVGAIAAFLTGTLTTGKIPYASGSGELSDSRAEQLSGGGLAVTGVIGDSQPTLYAVRTYDDGGSGLVHEVLINQSGELIRLIAAGTSVLNVNEAAINPTIPIIQSPEIIAAGVAAGAAVIAKTSQLVQVTGTGVITLPAMGLYPAYAILTIQGGAGLGPGSTLTPAPNTGDAYAVAPAAMATPYQVVRQYHDGTFWYTI